jgi:anti-anti-sigma factor
MFEIEPHHDGRIYLRGRFDAAQVKAANLVLDRVETSTRIDFAELEYIASAGLGALFAVQKRLARTGCGLRLVNLRPVIWEIFKIANFQTCIDIEPAGERRS